MNTDSKEFETIKSKLRKLQALAEKGYEGEAKTARIMLDRLCKQYGMTIEEILDAEETESYRFEIGKGKIWLDLFMQCFVNVTGQKTLKYYKASNSIIAGVELTAYQFAEISNLFAWHKENLKKDIEDAQRLVFEAYIHKHRLYRDKSNDPEGAEDEKDDKPVDFAYLQRLMLMMGNLNDNRYHKQIEAK